MGSSEALWLVLYALTCDVVEVVDYCSRAACVVRSHGMVVSLVCVWVESWRSFPNRINRVRGPDLKHRVPTASVRAL
jgi:hypothetical protein